MKLQAQKQEFTNSNFFTKLKNDTFLVIKMEGSLPLFTDGKVR